MKKVGYIVIVFILVGCAMYIGKSLIYENSEANTLKTDANISKIEVNENIENNNSINNVEIECNEQSNNEVISKNEVGEKNSDNSEMIPLEIVEQNESKQDKAINIVKQEWGEDDTVYFVCDEVSSDGKYVICIRDKATTNALYWCKVDIESETFTIE